MKINFEVFKFEGNRIRTIEKNNNLWFVARDVCNVLKFFNVANALKSLNKNDLTSIFLKSGEQKRKMTLVNENGLFALIFQSKQPEANRFFKWVCGA